jgi:hypothetical protein
MNWSRMHTTIAGVGLIVAVNAVALLGAAYNRSGEPESVLRLSERELRRPHQQWGFQRENSGLGLKLQWRVTTRRVEKDDGHYYAQFDRWGDPVWLDRAKLAELGIDIPAALDERGRRRYEKVTAKEVLLVLELEGEQYRAALARAHERAERLKARAAESKELRQRAEAAARQLELERSAASRLFVIDAGLDLAALRGKYPDRARYAIVQGRVQPRTGHAATATGFAGYIQAITIDEINVPFGMRAAFDGVATEHGIEMPSLRFEATVAHGRRLEPWLVGATRKTP